MLARFGRCAGFEVRAVAHYWELRSASRYDVDEAHDADNAITVLMAQPDIRVVFTDIRMHRRQFGQ
jgi:hypothetical protein